MPTSINWSPFYSNQEVIKPALQITSVMLPLLQDEVATHATVRHTIIGKVHTTLHLIQALIKTAGHLAYALSKQVQWLYRNIYRKERLLVMVRPLHIEITFLNLIGDWLENSSWAKILVKSNVAAPGRAESFLKGSHPKCSRYVHQDTKRVCHELIPKFNNQE